MRRIGGASSAIKQCLEIDPQHMQSWHLLSLLLSSQHEYKLALVACQEGLNCAPKSTKNISEEQRATQMELKITECAIIEVLEGPLHALSFQPSLFKTFVSLFEEYNTAATVTHKEISESSTIKASSSHTRKTDISLKKENSLLNIKRKGSKKKEQLTNNLEKSISSDDYALTENMNRVSLETTNSVQDGISSKGSSLIEPEEHAYELHRKELARSYLIKIWLVSCGLFRRIENWEDAESALAEAKKISENHTAIFCERGLLCYAKKEYDMSLQSFKLALAVDIDDVDANVGMAQTLLALPEDEQPFARDQAEALLFSMSKLKGWDNPDVWFLLGKCYSDAFLAEEADNALWYCYELETTQPVRHWKNVQPKLL